MTWSSLVPFYQSFCSLPEFGGNLFLLNDFTYMLKYKRS